MIPGHAGVRNVKWVRRIVLSDEEATGPWQRGMSYKGFGPSVTSVANIKTEEIPSLQEQPVQSVICYPIENFRPAMRQDGSAYVKAQGYAYSGGGRGIVRVDVSADGGKTWVDAKLNEGSEQPLNKAWAWTLWEADFNFTEVGGLDVCYLYVYFL